MPRFATGAWLGSGLMARGMDTYVLVIAPGARARLALVHTQGAWRPGDTPEQLPLFRDGELHVTSGRIKRI